MLDRKRILQRIAIAAATAIILAGGARAWTVSVYSARVYSLQALPSDVEPRVCVIFGAGVLPGNRPSSVLFDRVATAAELYRAGRVRTLLMTGDNRTPEYNEPAVMRATALRLGVRDEDIVLDFAGRRTYDSCYRAKTIFGVRRAVFVTQAFHLERALYLGDAFGIDCVGVVADRREYPRTATSWWSVREVVSTVAALVDVNLRRPVPILGDPLPIGG